MIRHHSLTLLLLIGLAAGDAFAQKPPPHPNRLDYPPRSIEVPDPAPLVHRLTNGTRVVVVEDHALPLVDVVVALPVGTFLDEPERPGIAELAGAMLRRGGTGSLDADGFDIAVDAIGARIDSRTGAWRSGATLDCLSETLEEALDLLFLILVEPAFDAERLTSVQTNLYAGFEARNDDPIAVMEREWNWLMLGQDHPEASQLTRAEVQGITAADLKAFHRRHWRPDGAVIAVSGDVKTQEILSLLERQMERWARAQPAGEPYNESEAATATAEAASPGLYAIDHQTPQAKVSLGHPVTERSDWLSKQALALEVGNQILGGTSGLVSRLNGILRSQGWVYRVLSELDPGRPASPDERIPASPGRFRIFLDAPPDKVLDTLEVCLQEIERLRRLPVERREFDVVREEMRSALALRFDTAEEIAGYYAEDLLLGRPHEYWLGYLSRLGALTVRDVQGAVRGALATQSMRALVVGGGERWTVGGSRNRQLARWLGGLRRLPHRDPVTLEPPGDR